MTETDFGFLRAFLKARSGLDLGSDKRYLAESRLEPVWREAGLGSLSALAARLRCRDDPELANAVAQAMTINETLFFRDRAPFETIRTVVLPRLLAQRAGTRAIRIWSAACSTGQEAYSVAMILSDMAEKLAGWRVEILGTDLSPAAVARARSGLYSQLEVQRGVPILALLRHFTQTEEGWQIAPSLRDAVQFRVFNLLDDLGPLGRFDLVLCRNLLIYLDEATKAGVLRRLAATLAPGGLLGLGGTETALGLGAPLRSDAQARGFYGVGPEARRAPPGLRKTG